MQARVATGVGGGTALGVLLACAPRPATALRELADASGTPDPAAPVVAAAALSAWALAAWLVLAVLLTVLGRVPGRLGRVAQRLARGWVPTAVRTGLELALGLTVATGVLGAGTGHAAAPVTTSVADRAAPPSSAAAASESADAATSGQTFDLDWPAPAADATPSRPARRPAELPTPPGEAVTPARTPQAVVPPAPPPAAAPARAGVVETPVTAAPAPPPAGTGAPPTPASAGAVETPVAAAPGTPAAVVVVQPGDTLWDLAAASLQQAGAPEPSDACIAQTWPRWWAANREVIGPDPDLILPGTPLSPPPDAAPVRPGS